MSSIACRRERAVAVAIQAMQRRQIVAPHPRAATAAWPESPSARHSAGVSR